MKRKTFLRERNDMIRRLENKYNPKEITIEEPYSDEELFNRLKWDKEHGQISERKKQLFEELKQKLQKED